MAAPVQSQISVQRSKNFSGRPRDHRHRRKSANLNRHSEADFLRVGSLLLPFLDSANQIDAGYHNLAGCTTGEQGEAASDVLAVALEFCRCMEALTTARAVHLTSLRTGTAAIRSALAGHLEATVSFRALCLLIRVETARLGDKGLEFAHFYEDVNELMARMNANVDDVQHVNGRLNAGIESAVATLSGMAKHLQKLSAVITGPIDGLWAFSARQEESIALSTRLANESEQVATAIQGAVKSIQFHDITRQQVQHVIGVLTRSSRTPE